MDEPAVVVETAGAVRTVRLNRPAKRNAMNFDMLDQLTDAFNAEPPEQERVTMLRAAGPAFCAGLDLSRDQGTVASGAPDADSPLHQVLDGIRAYPLPVVAVVQG